MATYSIMGDKSVYGAEPIPGYNALDSAANNPPVALGNEDEFGVVAVTLDGAPTIATLTTGRCKYRFGINSGTNTASAVLGDILTFEGTFSSRFSTDVDTDGKRSLIAGVAAGAITSGNKGWAQISGTASVNTGGNTVNRGDAVVLSTVDKVGVAVTIGTAPTHQVVGWAVAGNSGGFTTCTLTVPE